MKTENRTFFQTLGKTQLENLVKEVKETIAVDAPSVNYKTTFLVIISPFSSLIFRMRL